MQVTEEVGDFSRLRVGIVGPPGEGKSLTAASLSDKFDPTFSKPVVIDDLLWFLFDDGGLDSLTTRKIKITKKFDYRNLALEKEFNAELKDGLDKAKQMAARKEIKGVVFDTLSQVNARWLGWAFERYGKNWGTNDELGQRHLNFYTNVMGLGCSALFLFQVKAKPSGQNDDLGLSKFSQVLDIHGAHGNIYRTNMAIWAVRKETKPGGKKEVWLHPNGFGDVEGKDRYDLPDKVAPNLKEIFEQVKAKAAA